MLWIAGQLCGVWVSLIFLILQNGPRALWVDYFGAARERGPKQEPVPGRKRVNEDSETAWLKRRREKVGHGAASSLSRHGTWNWHPLDAGAVSEP